MELYFDVRPVGERGKETYTKGVFQIVAAPATDDNIFSTIAFYPHSSISSVPGTRITSTVLPNKGYRLEIFLPFKGLKSNHHQPGNTFNFTFGVNDADGNGHKTQIMWSGTGQNYADARLFGRLSPSIETE